MSPGNDEGRPAGNRAADSVNRSSDKPTIAPHEWSAWLRGAVAARLRQLVTITAALAPHYAPGPFGYADSAHAAAEGDVVGPIVAAPLKAPPQGKRARARWEHTCDRCGVWAPPTLGKSSSVWPLRLYCGPGNRIILILALCPTCLAAEGVSR